jgi:transcription-repair coupling factor (superfamily II helicase)
VSGSTEGRAYKLTRMTSTTQTTSGLRNALQRVAETQEFQQVAAEIERGARVISVSGLVAGSARALALAALQRETGRLFAIVTQSNRDLEPLERDLRFWYCALAGKTDCNKEVLLLPASESDPYAGSSPHAETLEQRALTLWRMARHPQDFVLLTARALARKTVAPAEIARAGTLLKRDEDHSPEELVEKLLASGYLREDPVGAVGEFSIRGGILDVWSPGLDLPVRIEFFGDTVESIREFDPETQLSTTQLSQIEIAPMRELTVTKHDFRNWAEAARERWSEERYARALRDQTAFADEGEAFPGWEWLMPLVRERNSSVFDYLKDAVLVIDDPSGIESYLSEAYQSLADRFSETEAADDLGLAPDELYLTTEELRERIDERPRLELRTLGRAAAEPDERLALEAESPKVQLGRIRSKRRTGAGGRMENAVGDALSRTACRSCGGYCTRTRKRHDHRVCDAKSWGSRTHRRHSR